MHRRKKKGLLAGLWEFPNVQKTEDIHTAERMSEELIGRMPDAEIPKVSAGKRAKHIFSHVEWHMEGIKIEITDESEERRERLKEYVRHLTGEEETAPDWMFVTPQEIQEIYPVPSAFEVYVKEVGAGREVQREE